MANVAQEEPSLPSSPSMAHRLFAAEQQRGLEEATQRAIQEAANEASLDMQIVLTLHVTYPFLSASLHVSMHFAMIFFGAAMPNSSMSRSRIEFCRCPFLE